MVEPQFRSREEYEQWKRQQSGGSVREQASPGPASARPGGLVPCADCGREISPRAASCPHCGAPQGVRAAETAFRDVSGLPPYYQEEFRRISESGERYRGKWNWAAFFFGPLWGLTKGVWLASIIGIAGFVFTLVIGIIYWFVFGARGNYLYYSAYVKNKQLPI